MVRGALCDLKAHALTLACARARTEYLPLVAIVTCVLGMCEGTFCILLANSTKTITCYTLWLFCQSALLLVRLVVLAVHLEWVASVITGSWLSWVSACLIRGWVHTLVAGFHWYLVGTELVFGVLLLGLVVSTFASEGIVAFHLLSTESASLHAHWVSLVDHCLHRVVLLICIH